MHVFVLLHQLTSLMSLWLRRSPLTVAGICFVVSLYVKVHDEKGRAHVTHFTYFLAFWYELFIWRPDKIIPARFSTIRHTGSSRTLSAPIMHKHSELPAASRGLDRHGGPPGFKKEYEWTSPRNSLWNEQHRTCHQRMLLEGPQEGIPFLASCSHVIQPC